MAAPLRRAVTSVTDLVFPVSKSVTDVPHQHLVQRVNEYVSNLPLQMSLYFNALFFPLWWVALVAMLEAKYSELSTLYRIILIAVLVVMTIIELIRLYLGYVGNLSEQVPELAGFWLLTVLLQLPLVLFLLLNTGTRVLPLERAVNIVMTTFVVFQTIVGYVAIRYLVNYQVTRFHLQQFEGQFSRLDDVQPDDAGFVNPGYRDNRPHAD